MEKEYKKYKDFANFFELLVEEKVGDIKRGDLAKMLGTNQPTISKIYGGLSLPSDVMTKRIMELWGEDISQKVKDAKKERNRDVRNIESKPRKTIYDKPMEERMPHIPTKVAAGGTGGISDSITKHDCEYMPIVKIFPKYQITMDVKGDSMSPKYENGDIIALRKVVDIIEWGSVYVLDTADGAVLKRLYDGGDKFKCVSFNPEYKDFYVDKENVYGVWKVVGLIRI